MEPNNANQDPVTPVTPTAVPQENILNEADFSMDGYDKHIRHARNWLFVVAGVQLIPIFMIMPIDSTEKWINVGIQIFVAIVFAALAFWTRKKPVAAIITALTIYVLLQVLYAIADPTTIFQGLIVKIGLIISLIVGLQNAREAERDKKAFQG